MLRRKCPKPEKLLEFVSIPEEISVNQRTRYRWHILTCKNCQNQIEQIRGKVDTLFSPEVDITSSLLSVYSRLTKDETLLLKGWKLDHMNSRPAPRSKSSMIANWVFRGAVAAGAAIALSITLLDGPGSGSEIQLATHRKSPIAEIRFEDKDQTEVHYVEPELYHSMEFETTHVSHTR